MARVCEDWFPKGTYKDQKGEGFYMDDVLKANLDALLKNARRKDDWDFVGIISGGGRVRVGKSVLEFQIAVYWTYMLMKLYGVKVPFTIKDNIVFVGSRLIEQGNKLGKAFPQSALCFDEAGADLEGLKVIRSNTQAVKDFLRECGQYNLLILLVIPEFFDLPKGIATTRSDFLIDVYVIPDKNGKFQRGYFNFYSRPNKKQLYLRGKKEFNYKAYKWDFHGRFYPFYPFDEQEYRKAKQEALSSRELHRKEDRFKLHRDVLFKILKDLGYSSRQTSELMREKGVIFSHMGVIKALEAVNQRNIMNTMCNINDVEGNLPT